MLILWCFIVNNIPTHTLLETKHTCKHKQQYDFLKKRTWNGNIKCSKWNGSLLKSHKKEIYNNFYCTLVILFYLVFFFSLFYLIAICVCYIHMYVSKKNVCVYMFFFFIFVIRSNKFDNMQFFWFFLLFCYIFYKKALKWKLLKKKHDNLSILYYKSYIKRN